MDTAKTDLKSDRWREEGPWLLLVLLPLAALAFRRGVLVAVVALALLPLPRPAAAFQWRDLWLRPDQQAAQLMKDGNAKAAASRFQDHRWRAAADYRAEQYDKAIQALGKADSADDHYNRGNALARLGKLKEAIAAYDQALRLKPGDKDARYNRDLLEKELRKKQKPQQGKGKGNKQQNQQDQQQSNQQQGGQSSTSDQSKDKSGQGQANQPKQNSKAGKSGEKNKPGADNKQGQKHEQPQSQAGQDKNKPKPQAQDQGKPGSGDQHNQGDKQAGAEKRGHPDDDKPTQADEQWLRRIPDDPGGLLRRKFYLQYSQGHKYAPSDQPW
jgi:Ca-activated chloride channel family protein